MIKENCSGRKVVQQIVSVLLFVLCGFNQAGKPFKDFYMATILTISASSDSGWVKVFIDGNEVLSTPGVTTVPLEEGIHFLTYFIQGLPGNNYRVGITEPPEEIWEVKGTLKLNHTTGQHGITL